MIDPFDSCWRRIDRAEMHRNEAVEAWNTWLEDEPYFVRVNHEGKGKFGVSIVQENPAPPEIGICTGEWLYNLRAALDYAVYATAVCDTGQDQPPRHDQLEFPCAYTEQQWINNEYRLSPLSEFHRDTIIKFMQPYRHAEPDTSALGWLHKLAKIDRHRRLSFVLGYVAEVKPFVLVPDGCHVNNLRYKRVVIDGEAEIARFSVRPWHDDYKVQVNPNAGIDPEIRDWAVSEFWSRIRYDQRLTMLRVAVEAVVVPLEYDCTGYSRKAKLLKESFRAELDARRKPGG